MLTEFTPAKAYLIVLPCLVNLQLLFHTELKVT